MPRRTGFVKSEAGRFWTCRSAC